MSNTTPAKKVRAVVNGLTLRGKGLVAVGLGLAMGAVLSGQRDLLSIALLAIALPLVSWWVIARTGFTLGCTRVISDRQVAVDQPIEVTVTVENFGSRRTATMLLSDVVPPSLGTMPQRIAPAMRPGEQRRITTTLHPRRRGRFRLGPLSVISVDPLGLVRLRRSFTSTDAILVTPRVHSLTAGTPHAEHLGRGDATLAALAARGDDDVVPREYRVGDDLRRIHWRATARTGQMMVRREELPWTRQASIVFDDRRRVHVGSGPDSSFELGLSAVASIGIHLLRSGFEVSVTNTDGRSLCPHLAGLDGETVLLDALAVATPREDIDATSRTDHSAWRADFLVAIVTDGDETGGLLGLRHPRRRTDLGIALIMDTGERCDDDRPIAHVLTAVRAGGWRTAVLARPEDASTNTLRAAWATALHDVTTDAGTVRR